MSMILACIDASAAARPVLQAAVALGQTLRALDRGARPPFGEIARDGQVFRLPER
jgi:hypothetical protein